MQKEMEIKIININADLERSAIREQKVIEDNRILNEKISFLEKENASLELEFKSAQNRYHQEVRAHQETEKSRLMSKEEANREEEVKGKCFAFKFESITNEWTICL